MDFKVILAIVIGLVALWAFIRLLPKDDNLHRNMKMSMVMILLVITAGIILYCVFFLGKKIYRNGVGELFTNYAEKPLAENNENNDGNEKASGDTLVITVNFDTIEIGEQSYKNAAEAENAIAEAVKSGKGLRVIDDYALATTYNELMDTLIKMNVSPADIEEIKQP